MNPNRRYTVLNQDISGFIPSPQQAVAGALALAAAAAHWRQQAVPASQLFVQCRLALLSVTKNTKLIHESKQKIYCFKSRYQWLHTFASPASASAATALALQSTFCSPPISPSPSSSASIEWSSSSSPTDSSSSESWTSDSDSSSGGCRQEVTSTMNRHTYHSKSGFQLWRYGHFYLPVSLALLCWLSEPRWALIGSVGIARSRHLHPAALRTELRCNLGWTASISSVVDGLSGAWKLENNFS